MAEREEGIAVEQPAYTLLFQYEVMRVKLCIGQVKLQNILICFAVASTQLTHLLWVFRIKTPGVHYVMWIEIGG